MSETSDLTRDDTTLLADIRSLYDTVDPVPANVLAAARAGLLWREVDTVVADITEDTALLGVRDERDTDGRDRRLITFEAPELLLEIDVTATGHRRRVSGQLRPPGPATIMVRWPRGCVGCEADKRGRFAVDGVPSGPMSVTCNRPDTAGVATSWITI
jgi:hypothetical protein